MWKKSCFTLSTGSHWITSSSCTTKNNMFSSHLTFLNHVCFINVVVVLPCSALLKCTAPLSQQRETRKRSQHLVTFWTSANQAWFSLENNRWQSQSTRLSNKKYPICATLTLLAWAKAYIFSSASHSWPKGASAGYAYANGQSRSTLCKGNCTIWD